MSSSKVVEAKGEARVSLADAFKATEPRKGIRADIARVRVIKKRNGEVYEDSVIEYGQHR